MRVTRAHAVALAFIGVATGAVGFVPLFGGPGYEHALATGLLAPSAVCIAQAIESARDDDGSPLASVGRGALLGLAAAAASLLTAVLHGLRVGVCEWTGALVHFALTALLGCVLAGSLGGALGEIVRASGARRARLACALGGLALTLGSAAVSVQRFWASPMIYAYDPFVGYFSGTLYDTVIEPGESLLTYRLGTLFTLSALALFASVSGRAPRGLRVDLATSAARARVALALACGVASLSLVASGARLGHWSTPASIAASLGAEKRGARCDVIYPATTRELEANLLVKDCDEELAAVEAALGARGPERVVAYFFRDADEKRRLMGAAHTYIAKPWRGEVYLQMDSYPHPVLGHELAHVVAGSFGRGPFKVAGEVGGLLPNPGLIEGIAVAASPDQDALTDLEWCRAMAELGLLPPVHRLFSLGFLGDASAKSYTVAGAFITWLMEVHGKEPVRRWYGGARPEDALGASLSTLGERFAAHVATVPLHPAALAVAKARFGRPGIFGRRCPHVVDALRQRADGCSDAQRYDEALRLYSDAVALDPTDFASRHRHAAVDLRHRDRAAGRAALLALAADEGAPQPYRDRADESLADADLLAGDAPAALARYEAVIARTVNEDAARTLEVKAAAARDPAARPAVLALLLGDGDLGPDIFIAGIELGAWGEATPSPLAAYLVGRNLIQRGRYEKGSATLERSLALGRVTSRVTREIVRLLAVSACARGDATALARAEGELRSRARDFEGAGGRRDAVVRLVSRCAR